MKVVIINRSDYLGGAAVVSKRLMKALNNIGVEARMLVIDRRDDDPDVQVIGSPAGNRLRFLLERLSIFVRNGFSRATLFKIDTGGFGVDISRQPWVREADVIVLNWVNQATLSLRGIRKLADLGKPVVWIMHDQWNATGICRYTYDCDRYLSECHDCPLTGHHGRDLSTLTQKRKARLYQQTNIHFLGVSHWVAGCCRESAIMKDCDISVLPNAFPAASFGYDRLHDPDICNAGPDKIVMVLGAARLDDPVKGFDTLIALTHTLRTKYAALADRLHLLLYGGIRDKALLDRLELPYTFLGYANEINRIMRNADILLSTARWETLPTTLVEGMASGCAVVTTLGGGQRDIVDHKVNGYVADGNSDVTDLARGVEWAVNARLDRKKQHDYATAKFDSRGVAERYRKYFESLLA